MSIKSLKKGISIIFIVNVINLVFKLITNFLFPKLLSVETYADLKYFQLLLSYLGVLHFGYIDGIYLHYGGKNLDKINKTELQYSNFTLIVVETIITVLVLIIGINTNDIIIVATACAIIPTEMINYYRFIYQATGEFLKYGRIMNLSTIILFVMNIALLIIGVDQVLYYILANLISLMGVWLIIQKRFSFSSALKWFNVVEIAKFFCIYAKSGFLIMIGNFMVLFFMGMDRWFVKALLPTVDFAQYSFAASTVSFLSVAVSSISVTLYNYFCKSQDIIELSKIRKYVLIFSATIITCAYPGIFIIQYFLPEYVASVQSLLGLFIAQMINSLISCFYVNLYKASKMQTKYFQKLIIVSILAFAFNVGIYLFFNQKEAFSLATCFTMFSWLLLCQMDFSKLKLCFGEMTFLIIASISFYLFGIVTNPLLGMIGYISLIILSGCIFMKTEMKYIFYIILRTLKLLKRNYD